MSTKLDPSIDPESVDQLVDIDADDDVAASEVRRVTIKMPQSHYDDLDRRARSRHLSVPELLRRDASLAKALERYIDDDTLTVLEPNNKEAVHLHLV